MKNLLIRILLILFLVNIFINNSIAQDTKQSRKTEKAVAVKNLIDSQNFVFVAQYAIPFRGTAKYLTSPYDVRISKDTVVSYLPFFGRATSITDPQNFGFEFTSTTNTYIVKPIKKGWEISFKPNKQMDIMQYYFTIFDNGTASLRITSMNRDPISFQGFIRERSRER